MSRYAYDPGRRAVVVSWATGSGDLAATVATLSPATPDRDALRLVEQLTFLTAAVWRTYTHPASAAPDLTAGSEGWRCDNDRQAFTGVLTAILTPELARITDAPASRTAVRPHFPATTAAQRSADTARAPAPRPPHTPDTPHPTPGHVTAADYRPGPPRRRAHPTDAEEEPQGQRGTRHMITAD